MQYVIGIEGTQATTTAAVADTTGCVLGLHHGPGIPSFHEAGGPELARRGVAEAVQAAIAMADLQNARFAAACLGAEEDAEACEGLCIPVIPAERLLIAPRARMALASVTLGRPGVVALAGAGAAVCGVNAAGEVTTSGGWGAAMGDEGSGTWIAHRALNACCRATDGIGPATQILPLLLEHLEADDFRVAFRRMNAGPLSAARITTLMEVTRFAASQNDAAAQRILREAGRELGQAVGIALRRLGMQEGLPAVGTVGEVFQAGRMVLRAFREVVLRAASGVTILPAQAPMAVGGVVLALEALGVEISQPVQARLTGTAPPSR